MKTSDNSEIEARLQTVLARAHRTLTNDEQTLVRKRIRRDLDLRVEMRSLPLANGDAPDAGFLPRDPMIGDAQW